MTKFVGIGVGIIVKKGTSILMLRRKNVHGDGTWSTPGGHLEFGESPEECAIRETKEETDITVSNPQFYALTNDFFPEHGKHFITIWMEAEFQFGEPKVTAEYESDRVEWKDMANLPTPLFAPFEKVILGKTLPKRETIMKQV